ncbi:hypothetical protein [Enterococcus gilvus]|uniref:hypothetical protein n=1 Tax=Enterococcus gilvus TaxID=160453 RepID=UPI0028D5B1D7|nr:hypothetical protein [Enterococcus gilvus]
MKKFLNVIAICTLAIIIFVGCGSNSNHQDTSTISTKKSSAQGFSDQRSTADSKLSETSSSSKREDDQSSTTQSSNDSYTSSSNTVSSVASETSNSTPYAVDISQFRSPVTFSLKGVNVPSTITIVDNDKITVNFGTRNGSPEDQYEAQVANIPIKEIRVFSNEDNSIRTVKANTQITLVNGSGRHINEVLYLIVNSNGGYSLLTPNYAGNVLADQTDVMLEAI